MMKKYSEMIDRIDIQLLNIIDTLIFNQNVPGNKKRHLINMGEDIQKRVL